MGRADDLLMEGLPAQQSGFFLLTPTTTVSSPWNLGRNWSPRKISDWFRGRKRHSTFMLHSAGASAIAQIQGGGCCFLLRGKMLLTLEAIRSWAWSVRLNKLWVMRAGSGPLISRRLWGWRIGRPVSVSTLRETIINLCAAGRVFVSQWGGQAKLDVKAQNNPLHH